MTIMKNLKNKSAAITNGDSRAPNRAMLRAVGFKDEDFGKPIVGVASTWSEITPCNAHIDELARKAKQGVSDAGGVAQIFGTITVSDGISMGTEGMKYSLASREVIADSVELVSGAQRFDGLVAIGGCDKNMPGCIMAMARLNIPSVFVYGGTILPGQFEGKDVISSVHERSARSTLAKYRENNLRESSARPVLHPVRAAACTQPTPWHPQLKRSACHCPAARRIPLSARKKPRTRKTRAKQSSTFWKKMLHRKK